MALVVYRYIVALKLVACIASAGEIEVKLALGLLFLLKPPGLIEMSILGGWRSLLLALLVTTIKMALSSFCRFLKKA